MSVLTSSFDKGVATITLNNPPENRLTSDVMMAFVEILGEISSNSDVRAVVLKAEGNDFSFGGDFTPWPEIPAEEMQAMLDAGIPLSNTFENLDVPTIALVQGNCRGGGFELALRADFIIAADNASFRHSEATLGVFTFLGGIQRVAERVGKTRAMQWAMTAEDVSADEAAKSGLINKVVSLNELESTGQTWAEKLGNGPTISHRSHKQILRAWSNGGIAAADEIMPTLARKIIQTKDARGATLAARNAAEAGQERPDYPFEGK